MNEGDEYICKVTILGDFEKTSKLVRCKDCNNRGTSNCPIEELCGWIPSDDWFCADGIRREDNA